MKIELLNISKKFGDFLALNNISFTVNSGRAFGILGRNGAGKTTTIRILLNIIEDYDGKILIDGKDIRTQNIKFGYLPEERGLYLKYKVSEQLAYFGELNGLNKKICKAKIKEFLEKFNISEYYNKKVDELSKGNKQKIQLIAALLHDPDVIVLDEPFSGLDPINIEMFKEVIDENIQKGKTVMFSSHQMTDVEELCDDIIMFKKGEIILSGNLEKIKDSYGNRNAFIKVDRDLEPIVTNLNIKILENKNNEYKMEFEDEKEVNKLISAILKNGIVLKEFRYVRPSLNQIFIEKLGD